MGSLILRSVDNELVERLGQRDMADGASAQAEHREFLRQAVTDRSSRLPYGDLSGQIWIAEDFDDTPQDIIDAMKADLFPILDS
jgi:hypothetical protein